MRAERAAAWGRGIAGTALSALVVGAVVLTDVAGGGAAVAADRATVASPTPTRTPATKLATKPAGKPATKPKTPPRIKDLKSLDRWINAAVLAKGSASFSDTVLVGSTPSYVETGQVRWVNRVPEFALTSPPAQYVGELKAVVLPHEAYAYGDLEKDGHPEWTRVYEGTTKGNSVFWTEMFALLRPRLNPSKSFVKLPKLPVTRSRRPVVVDGVPCWVFSVRMTTVQRFAELAPEYRPSPQGQAGGTSTVSWWVDATGLPHRFVVVNSWPKQGSYREVTTYSGWGRPVTITRPSPVAG